MHRPTLIKCSPPAMLKSFRRLCNDAYICGVFISLSEANKLLNGYTTEAMTHGRYDARPTVTFPVTQHNHGPLAGTSTPSPLQPNNGAA